MAFIPLIARYGALGPHSACGHAAPAKHAFRMTIANLSRYGTLASLLLAALAGSPATAQELQLSTERVAQARAAMARNDPAEALSRYLRALAIRPRDMESLLGAGRAAREIGDPNAALGFFARAEEIEPRNRQVKAGLGL